jgi:hypothetical protein
MAKNDETKPDEGATATEFPVTIGEFLSEVPASKVESKAAFRQVMATEGYTGNKLRADWNALFEQFSTKPTAVTWKEWTSPKGGN